MARSLALEREPERTRSPYRTINWVENLRPPRAPLPGLSSKRGILVLGLIIATLYMVSHAARFWRYESPALEAMHATGVVVSKELRGSAGPSRRCLLTVRLTLGDGDSVTLVTPCEASIWQRLAEGERVNVGYRASENGGVDVIEITALDDVPSPALGAVPPAGAT